MFIDKDTEEAKLTPVYQGAIPETQEQFDMLLKLLGV